MHAPPVSAPSALMPLAGTPSPWQVQMAAGLRRALQATLQHSAPASDTAEAAGPALTPWRTERIDHAVAVRGLAPTAALMPLYQRCLQHYRDQLRPRDESDEDAGAALACLLAASLQSLEAHPVTPSRWAAITTWLNRELIPDTDWKAVSTDQRQAFFARMALLAVALGEWSLEASKQNAIAQASARLMAEQHLRSELGLEADHLLRAMRWIGVIPQVDRPRATDTAARVVN